MRASRSLRIQIVLGRSPASSTRIAKYIITARRARQSIIFRIILDLRRSTGETFKRAIPSSSASTRMVDRQHTNTRWGQTSVPSEELRPNFTGTWKYEPSRFARDRDVGQRASKSHFSGLLEGWTSGCSKLPKFCDHGNRLVVSSNDAAPHDELQTAGTLKQHRPMQR